MVAKKPLKVIKTTNHDDRIIWKKSWNSGVKINAHDGDDYDDKIDTITINYKSVKQQSSSSEIVMNEIKSAIASWSSFKSNADFQSSYNDNKDVSVGELISSYIQNDIRTN